MDLQELVERSWAIRQAYHELEVKHHDSKWTVEEDLLALSNDIGNFQRLVMTKQGRYYDETRSEERRVGKECASMCRSRWSPYH